MKEKEKEKELQRKEAEKKEKEKEIMRKREKENLANIEPRSLVEHEEITSSIFTSEVEGVILNQLKVEADPSILPTVSTVEETKEETITLDASTVNLLFLCNYFILLQTSLLVF